MVTIPLAFPLPLSSFLFKAHCPCIHFHILLKNTTILLWNFCTTTILIVLFVIKMSFPLLIASLPLVCKHSQITIHINFNIYFLKNQKILIPRRISQCFQTSDGHAIKMERITSSKMGRMCGTNGDTPQANILWCSKR